MLNLSFITECIVAVTKYYFEVVEIQVPSDRHQELLDMVLSVAGKEIGKIDEKAMHLLCGYPFIFIPSSKLRILTKPLDVELGMGRWMEFDVPKEIS